MKQIGGYRVIGLLGRGGMGRVFKVATPDGEAISALKLLQPRPELVAQLGRDEIRRRFEAEARLMASLDHPHILRAQPLQDTPDGIFYLMACLCRNLGDLIGEGHDLESETRATAVESAVDYMLQTLDGLSTLHEAGVVHRDIKPFNLLLDERDRIQIADFGLSRLRGEHPSNKQAIRIGSPYYAAPEQIRDAEDVGPPADLYSVGVTFYRLVTGRLPEENGRRADPRWLNRSWRVFFGQALAADPAQRFQRAEDMSMALLKLRTSWRQSAPSSCRLTPEPERPSTENRTGASLPTAVPRVIRPREARDRLGLDRLGRPNSPRRTEWMEEGRTVRDAVSGLVWQRSGSAAPLPWPRAAEYVRGLNLDQWEGRSDWRLPTAAELLTLLESPLPATDDCLPLPFDGRQKWLWSADRRSALAAWYVSSVMGFAHWQDMTCPAWVRAVRGPD